MGGQQEERKPLGRVFVGEPGYVVIRERVVYGPFFNHAVAAMWGADAFGRGSYQVQELAVPWSVPIEERKS